MSAYAGSLVPASSPHVALDLLPLVLFIGALIVGFFSEQFDPRRRQTAALVPLGIALGLLALHIVHLLVLDPAQRVLRDVRTNVVRLGSFDANLGFSLDLFTAFLLLVPLAGSFYFGTKIKFGKKNSTSAARFHASVLLLDAGVATAVLGDGFVTLSLGLSVAMVATYLLVVRDDRLVDSVVTAGRVFLLQSLGFAALFAGFVTLFWHLGGALRDDGYLPDFRARFVAAHGPDHVRESEDVVIPDDQLRGERSAEAVARQAKERGSLTFTSHPGARLYLDIGDQNLDRVEPFATAPFVRKEISTGPHEVVIVPGGGAIITGDGQEASWIERFVVGTGENVTIVPLGQTMTFAELDDQLELKNEEGRHFLRNQLHNRSFWRFLGVVPVVVFLAALASLLVAVPVFLVPWFGKESSAPTWHVLRISAVVLALIPLFRLRALVSFHWDLIAALTIITGALVALVRSRKPSLILGAATFALISLSGLASVHAEEARLLLRPERGEIVELEYAPDGETMQGAFVLRNEGSAPVEVTGAKLRGNEAVRHSPPFVTVEIEGAKGAPVVVEPGKPKRVVIRWRYGASRAREVFGHVFVEANAPSSPSLLAVHASRPRDLGPFGDRALSFVLGFPLVAAFLALVSRLVRRDDPRVSGGASALVFGVHLAFVLALASQFDSQFKNADGNEGLQFIERSVLAANSGIEWFLGVDGVSLTFVILTSMAAFFASLGSFTAKNRILSFHIFGPVLVSSLMGVFLARDLFLVTLFWFVAAIALTLLIANTAGKDGRRGALGFGAMTLAGAVFLGASAHWLHEHSDPTYLVDGRFVVKSWAIPDLARVDWLHTLQGSANPTGFLLVWSALFLIFTAWLMTAGRVWAFLDAPTNMIVPVAWVAMALYGLLRFEVGIMPLGLKWAATTVIFTGLAMLVVFTALARKQSAPRMWMGHVMSAHAGIALIGLGSCTPQGFASVVHVMASLVVATALFAMLGQTLRRQSLESETGLAAKMPLFAAMYLLATFAIIGLPALVGFWGPLLAVVGVFPRQPWLAFAAILAMVFLGTTVFQKAGHVLFTSTKDKSSTNQGTDLQRSDLLVFAPIVLLALALGLAPRTLYSLLDAVILDLHRLVDAAGPLQVG